MVNFEHQRLVLKLVDRHIERFTPTMIAAACGLFVCSLRIQCPCQALDGFEVDVAKGIVALVKRGQEVQMNPHSFWDICITVASKGCVLSSLKTEDVLLLSDILGSKISWIEPMMVLIKFRIAE